MLFEALHEKPDTLTKIWKPFFQVNTPTSACSYKKPLTSLTRHAYDVFYYKPM